MPAAATCPTRYKDAAWAAYSATRDPRLARTIGVLERAIQGAPGAKPLPPADAASVVRATLPARLAEYEALIAKDSGFRPHHVRSYLFAEALSPQWGPITGPAAVRAAVAEVLGNLVHAAALIAAHKAASVLRQEEIDAFYLAHPEARPSGAGDTLREAMGDWD